MERLNYDSPESIRRFLEKSGLNLSKRFGQNFLVNPGARSSLLRHLCLDGSERVWEIGAGLGAMTKEILPKVARLTAFEVDWGFCRVLDDEFGGESGFSLVEGSFLKTWKAVAGSDGIPEVIFGNLPYSTGMVMIIDLLKKSVIPGRMVFTLQKEVVQRMIASPGSKEYSISTLLCRYHCDVEHLGDLQPKCFYPPPRVTSSIVRMTPHGRFKLEQPELFYALVNDLFRARRKTARNNLKSGSLVSRIGGEKIDAVLDEVGVNDRVRGETLSIEELVAIAELLSKDLS